mmetsp:Transcript_26345/g.34619  ORF Transcript_26345/g.34619 Transcript_26345/m.34619 type:complete len:352 (+) Transcript_26345:103-1158(+)
MQLLYNVNIHYHHRNQVYMFSFPSGFISSINPLILKLIGVIYQLSPLSSNFPGPFFRGEDPKRHHHQHQIHTHLKVFPSSHQRIGAEHILDGKPDDFACKKDVGEQEPEQDDQEQNGAQDDPLAPLYWQHLIECHELVQDINHLHLYVIIQWFCWISSCIANMIWHPPCVVAFEYFFNRPGGDVLGQVHRSTQSLIVCSEAGAVSWLAEVFHASQGSLNECLVDMILHGNVLAVFINDPNAIACLEGARGAPSSTALQDWRGHVHTTCPIAESIPSVACHTGAVVATPSVDAFCKGVVAFVFENIQIALVSAFVHVFHNHNPFFGHVLDWQPSCVQRIVHGVSSNIQQDTT